MKLTKNYPTADPPPPTSYTLELTPHEWHDLRQLASVDFDKLRELMKTAPKPYPNSSIQTHALYILLASIRDAK